MAVYLEDTPAIFACGLNSLEQVSSLGSTTKRAEAIRPLSRFVANANISEQKDNQRRKQMGIGVGIFGAVIVCVILILARVITKWLSER